LLDTMYELPSLGNVKKVVVDENAVNGTGKPILVRDDGSDEVEDDVKGQNRIRGAA